MGAPKQPSTTTQVQKVELPQWVDSASQQNYQLAQQLGQRPYVGYEGETVAGLSPQEQAASGTLAQGQQTTNSALQAALQAAGAAGGYRPQMVQGPGGVANVNAQGFLDRNINDYMDPNIDSVVNSTLSNMDRGIAQGQQGISDQARGAGAWGGSRFGVQQAVYGAEGERAKASTEGQLRQAAFSDAASRLQQDNQSALQAALANQQSGLTTQGQGLQAALANQQAGLAGANLGLQAGGLFNQIGQTANDTAGKNTILQSQLGATDRAIQQARLDSQRSEWEAQQNWPVEQLNLQLAALGMSPYGKTSTTTSTAQQGGSSSPFLTGLGALGTIGSFLFSDRDVKKDVKRVGKVPGTDLNAYEFKYKRGFMGRADDKKHVGLMAQDVEKKVPSAVKTVDVNGKKVKAVNYEKAIGIGGRAA